MALITDTQTGARYSGSFTASLTAAVQALSRMLRLRLTLNALAELDDYQLKDIGLTRNDLLDMRMASSADAFGALARIRLYR